MTLHMLDLETSSIKPEEGSIRTIQTRSLIQRGEPLVIRHADDFDSERQLLQSFQDETKFFTNKWNVTACGFNLGFEWKWLGYKAIRYGVVPYNWDVSWLYDKPQLDLHHFAILCRGGQFDGTKLSDYSAKALDGNTAAAAAYDRTALEQYITEESDAFCDFYWELIKHCGPLMEQTIRPELTRLHQLRQQKRESELEIEHDIR